VKVHRKVETTPEREHQGCGSRGPQQSGHVLDRKDVCARVDDALGELEVVVQGVQLLARILKVTGVAKRHLGHGGTCGAHGLDGRAHLVDVVQGVEDAEDVYPCARRLGDERFGHGARIWRIPDRVAASKQHLQRQVGHGAAQQRQPLPGVL
jgi:hypothetical protein